MANKLGLNHVQEPVVQSYQHKKSFVYLMLTTFGNEITFLCKYNLLQKEQRTKNYRGFYEEHFLKKPDLFWLHLVVC